MEHLTTLISRSRFHTEIGFDFVNNFRAIAEADKVDAFIVATEDGFSPLGAACDFFADDLGITVDEIQRLANWNRFENERVTLVALKSRKEGGRLRGIILAPCENSECYKKFAAFTHGAPARDFYYNVTYEAIAYAAEEWKARKLGISHLSGSQSFHQDIATCNAEALAHFCDPAVGRAALDSFAFVGCCINREHLDGISRLNPEGEITRHLVIHVEREAWNDAVLIHLSLRLPWVHDDGPQLQDSETPDTVEFVKPPTEPAANMPIPEDQPQPPCPQPDNAWARCMLEAVKDYDQGRPVTQSFIITMHGKGQNQISCMTFLEPLSEEKKVIRDYLTPFNNQGEFKVLDIGCGVGRHLEFIRKTFKNAKLFGTEQDPAISACCRDRVGVDMTRGLEDFEPGELAAFLLMSNGVGIFGTPEGLDESLKEIYDRLRDGGVLIGECVIGKGASTEQLTITFGNNPPTNFAWMFCGRDWLRPRLEEVGFEIVHQEQMVNEPGGVLFVARKPCRPAGGGTTRAEGPSLSGEVVDPPPAPPTPVKTAPQSALAYGNPPPLHQPEIPRPGDEPNPMLINKRDVSQGQWAQLRNNVVANIEDLNYLNEWAYAGIRLPDAATLMGFLQGNHCQCWLIRAETESGPQMVGFINYGNVIPHHRYAFGLVVGRRFARRGYGMRAMVEFITRREEFGIGELHGYCNRNNASIVNLMRRMNVGGMGFVQDNAYRDPIDREAIHFALRRLP